MARTIPRQHRNNLHNGPRYRFCSRGGTPRGHLLRRPCPPATKLVTLERRLSGATVTAMEVRGGNGKTTCTWNPFSTWGSRHLTDEQERRAELLVYVTGQESECRYLTDRHGYTHKEAPRATHGGASSDRNEFSKKHGHRIHVRGHARRSTPARSAARLHHRDQRQAA